MVERRVVLGEGYPLFLFDRKGIRSILKLFVAPGFEKDAVVLDTNEGMIYNGRKIRLVAEEVTENGNG